VACLDKAMSQVLAIFRDGSQVRTGNVVKVLCVVGRNVNDVVSGVVAVAQDVVKNGVPKTIMLSTVELA
jgi:hypothetical protein